MPRIPILIIGALLMTLAARSASAYVRPPAVPLVTHDPYFTIWSAADRLTDDPTRHWTGAIHALTGLARVDGQPFRFMGALPAEVQPMGQVSCRVWPTRTVYVFDAPTVRLTLTFTTPMLPEDLEVLSRPVSYLTWEAESLDDQPHQVSVYFDASAEIAVNSPDQEVVWDRPAIPGLTVLRTGAANQQVLGRTGDDLRIEWGYLYAAAEGQPAASAIGPAVALREAFCAGAALPQAALSQPRAASDKWPALAFQFDLAVAAEGRASCSLMLAYDDLWSIQYLGEDLRPFWRRNGADAADLLTRAWAQRESLAARCAAFDAALTHDLTDVGGPAYADLCALAYRQGIAGNKLAADSAGMPLLFPKECFSNGCIATVDVIYPMLPQFLALSPILARASLQPLLDYAASPRWKFDFAPHDMGQYPHANGQVYGGGERDETNQMPVEESANMILLMAALARAEGSPDYAAAHWPLMTKWAEYLKARGLDPANQLCTDDFAGHLAHNANLSVKAILALAAYAQLCDLRGLVRESAEYRQLALDFAARWQEMAAEGDHYRLAFDREGTWSQKYNLIWDRLLGLGVFPPEVARREVAFYRTQLRRYGLPLDSRSEYTKLDWTIWTATLTGERADFDALLGPLMTFLLSTPDRVPMTDWYWTHDARKVGFQARPVVGGVFIKLLDDPALWRRLAGQAQMLEGDWAPLPTPPVLLPVVPAADREPSEWRFTTTDPGPDWFAEGFDDAAWPVGLGGFGSANTPGALIGTEWTSDDIWLRHEVTLPEQLPTDPYWWLHHDEDATIYLNGVEAAHLGGYTTAYKGVRFSEAARAALRPGRNLIAVHCRQTTGGQYIDLGLSERTPQ